MEINHKYVLILQQKIQTVIPQIVNRIEIGILKNITEKSYIILTEHGKRTIKRKLVKGFINLDEITILNTQFYFDKIEQMLQ